MSSQDDQERLKRLREKQIASRDPLKKQRKLQRYSAGVERKRKKVTIGEMFRDLSHKWQGLIGGLILGLFTWILLAIFIQENWVDLIGISAILIFCILGIMLGAAFDWRDNLRDF